MSPVYLAPQRETFTEYQNCRFVQYSVLLFVKLTVIDFLMLMCYDEGSAA